MFNINAMLKFINVNNDEIIQKSEVEQFTNKLEKPSIFSDYFNSISNDADYYTVLEDVYSILDKENNKNPQIHFKNEKDTNNFEQLCKMQNEKDIAAAKEYCLRNYIGKAASMEEFNEIVKEAIDEGGIDNIYTKFKEQEYTKPINMEMLRAALPADRGGNGIKLPKDLVFPDINWSNSREVFKYIGFNEKTFSKTSKEHLPQGYDPQVVFDKGRKAGLGIDEVHDMGYTGKGIGVAICDWKLNPHKDLNIKEYQCTDNAAQMEDPFHSSAVAGVLAGKQTGVAPDSDVYFFAEYPDSSTNGGNDMINTLQNIIDKNKELPDDKKIRVVSISGSIYGDEEKTSKLVKELNDSGVWVLSSPEFAKNFSYLDKKDPMGDSNDFNNYEIGHEKPTKDYLYVNAGDRTIPDPASPTAYRHDSKASQSWAIPVVAGYYALACQANKNMTPEKFIELAHKTAKIQNSTFHEYGDNSNVPTGRSKETVPIKIIDIKALLQAIENGKY